MIQLAGVDTIKKEEQEQGRVRLTPIELARDDHQRQRKKKKNLQNSFIADAPLIGAADYRRSAIIIEINVDLLIQFRRRCERQKVRHHPPISLPFPATPPPPRNDLSAGAALKY